MSADSAYSSNANFELVHDVGGNGFIAFKTTATGKIGGLFAKMLGYLQFQQEEYQAHYHKRSNGESCFSAVKRRFGDSVICRSNVGMVNEVLRELLCHNLTCLIQEQETLGIAPVFWQNEAKTDTEGPAILRIPSR